MSMTPHAKAILSVLMLSSVLASQPSVQALPVAETQQVVKGSDNKEQRKTYTFTDSFHTTGEYDIVHRPNATEMKIVVSSSEPTYTPDKGHESVMYLHKPPQGRWEDFVEKNGHWAASLAKSQGYSHVTWIGEDKGASDFISQGVLALHSDAVEGLELKDGGEYHIFGLNKVEYMKLATLPIVVSGKSSHDIAQSFKNYGFSQVEVAEK